MKVGGALGIYYAYSTVQNIEYPFKENITGSYLTYKL